MLNYTEFTEAELAALTTPPQAMAMLLAALLRKRYMGQYMREIPASPCVEESKVTACV